MCVRKCPRSSFNGEGRERDVEREGYGNGGMREGVDGNMER